MSDSLPVIISENPVLRRVEKALPFITLAAGIAATGLFTYMLLVPAMVEFRWILMAIVLCSVTLIIVSVRTIYTGDFRSPRTKGCEIQIHSDRIKVAKHLDLMARDAPSDDRDFFVLPVAEILKVTKCRRSLLTLLTPVRSYYGISMRERSIFISRFTLGPEEERFAQALARIGLRVETKYVFWQPLNR